MFPAVVEGYFGDHTDIVTQLFNHLLCRLWFSYVITDSVVTEDTVYPEPSLNHL